MSQQNEDFISFEKALRNLSMQSEQLKKLVSEGGIRAFRDGDSMKFRRDDIDALSTDADEFDFALEDDTGMVTEELSAEDTLLSDDDLLDDDEVETVRRASAPASARSARAKVVAEPAQAEPAWTMVVSGLSFVLLLYGAMVVYTIAMGNPPEGLTSMWK